MVVARLLPPAEVGLFAMATLVLTITRALTETGFEQALIQRTELDDETLDVGFTVVLLRAALVAAVRRGRRGLVRRLFRRTARRGAVARAGDRAADRRLHQQPRSRCSSASSTFGATSTSTRPAKSSGCVTTIGAALRLHNVWAVVYGQLAAARRAWSRSYLLAHRRPRLRLDQPIARELLSYGRWVGASSVLLFVLVNGDNLFIGKVVGAEALAFYAWAYQLANLPALFITQILSSVMFPAFATRARRPSASRRRCCCAACASRSRFTLAERGADRGVVRAVYARVARRTLVADRSYSRTRCRSSA